MDPTHEATPDQLLSAFRGRGLKTIILFTIAVHAVVVLGSSVPFLWRVAGGKNTASLSEDERVGLAMNEATSALRKIAEAHGLRPQDLASRLDGGTPRAPREQTATTAAAKTAVEPAVKPGPADATDPAKPEQAKSEVEKEIEKVKQGPSTPPVEEEVDLFK